MSAYASCGALRLSIAAVLATQLPMPASAQSSSDESATTIENVVVSARRRDENLQDVPVAISALTADQLQTQNGTYHVALVVSTFIGLAANFIGGWIASRVSIQKVMAAGNSAKSLARRMAYRDFQLERFLSLNGLAGNTRLMPSQKVKLVVYGTRRT